MAAPQEEPKGGVVFAGQEGKPVMMQGGPDGQYTTTGQRPGATIYDVPQGGAAQGPEPATDTPRYLLAFKARTIYSVIAYWTDGAKQHYSTSGNVPKQGPTSLLDRRLTA